MAETEITTMSRDYLCKLTHERSQGETTITIRVREGQPYRTSDDMEDIPRVIEKVQSSEAAVMRALTEYLG